MEQLKPSELALGQFVQFHPKFQNEEWNTGLPPFKITDTYRMEKKKKKELWAVSYTCSSSNCSRCNRKRCNGVPNGHILLLKKGGEHTSPHVVLQETKKKKTITHLLPNPVFVDYDPTS